MSAAIASSTSNNQEQYRAQMAQGQADKRMASLSRSMQSSLAMGKAIGADTSSLQSAVQKVEARGQSGAASKVSLSSEGVAKLKAEEAAKQSATGASAQTGSTTGTTGAATQTGSTSGSTATAGTGRQRFASIDEAIAYGTRRATEQAAKQSGATTAATTTQGTAASGSTATVQSTAKGTAQTASQSGSQSGTQAGSQSGSQSGSQNGPVQFKSIDDAISYGARKAVEQYAKIGTTR